MTDWRTAALRRLAEHVAPLLCADFVLRLWDGSETKMGPAARNDLAIAIRSPAMLTRLVRRPRLTSLIEGFATGDLAIEGGTLLDLAARAEGGRRGLLKKIDKRLAARALLPFLFGSGSADMSHAFSGRADAAEYGKGRDDRALMQFHYDLSNAFYEFLLDPQMAYSCGYWTQEASAEYGLADAQRDKLDLICRKLGLEPGMRLLDVGCGWASLLIHAAQHYGVEAVGVTLSAEQRALGQRRVRELGLQDRVEIRLQDYREIPDEPFDAISSIEMGEHVGQDNYPVYAAQLQRLLLPHGRLLLQQMSRGASGNNTAPGGGAFMESYVAPDMFMRPLGDTLNVLEAAGLEVVDVQSLREHYVWTVRPWLDTLQDNKSEAVSLIGEEQYRVWLLYLAGAALAFEENRMGVHQMLLVRPSDDGRSGLPRSRAATLGADPALDRLRADVSAVEPARASVPTAGD